MLEACDLSPMAIRRTIWHLKMQGWFEHASGFLIGRPLAAFGVDESTGRIKSGTLTDPAPFLNGRVDLAGLQRQEGKIGAIRCD